MVQQTILNGIAVGELSECMSSMQRSPDIGKCTFKAKNKWVSGAYCQTEISDFCASGEVIHRDTIHVIEGDEPVLLIGSREIKLDEILSVRLPNVGTSSALGS